MSRKATNRKISLGVENGALTKTSTRKRTAPKHHKELITSERVAAIKEPKKGKDIFNQ
jgi:hypothetical protein